MRALFVLPLSFVVACGLGFAPGDYREPSGTTPAPLVDASGGTEASSLADAGADAQPEADGSPAVARHVLLFSGTKDKDTDTNDVWVAPVDAAGTVGAFGYLQSTPLSRPLQAAAIAGGKVLTVVQGSSSRVVESADFANGITSSWTTAVVPNAPTSSYGSFFAKTSLVVVGGQTSEQVDDGMGGTTTVTTNHAELYVNRASGAQYPPPNNAVSTTKLPAGVVAPTIVLYGDFAFVWGQGDKNDATTKIYVGRVDDAVGLASVSDTLPLTAAPVSPIACAGEGRLFVAGGTSSAHTYAADIDEGTGALKAWKNGPDLPAPRSAAGCAVLQGWLYVFGGRVPSASTTALSNQILRAKIGADGTLGEWETTAQALIGPRANVFALTY